MVNSYIPKNLNETLSILAEQDSIVFAGGTDLMIKHKNWTGNLKIEKPVIFIANIPELKKIIIEDENLIIGAAVTCNEIIESKLVPQYIKNVISTMASPAIRNTATIGGNICNSSPVADSLPLLYACESKLQLERLNSKKIIDLQEFIIGPGKNTLEKKEILTKIIIPLKKFNKILFKKVGTRNSIALAKLSFMGMAEIDKSTKEILDLKLSFGAVGPTIIKSKKLENRIIKEKKLDNKIIKIILEEYSKLIIPITDQRSDKEYRKNVSIRLLESFLKSL